MAIQCQLTNCPNRLEYLNAVDLILWDEFPSCDREVFEAAYRALRGFERKVIVTMGDMRQIAPVVVNGDKEDVINHSVPSSPLWPKVFVKKLTKNMRLLQLQQSEPLSAEEALALQHQRQFGDMILDIGNGTHQPLQNRKDFTCETSHGAFPVELPGCARIEDRNEAISYIFPAPLTKKLTIGMMKSKS